MTSIPPASRPPCSSESASWRTTGRSRDPSGVRDAVPGHRGPLRRRPSRDSRRRPNTGRSPGRSPAAPHLGPSSDGSRSSLSRPTTIPSKTQPLKMAFGPGSGRTLASALLPAPSARGRAVQCHKQTFPVTSMMRADEGRESGPR